MRRIVLWGLSTVSAVVLLFGYHTSTEGVSAQGTALKPMGGSLQTGQSATTSGGTGSAGPTPSSADGATVTGDVAQTEWGPVQVQITEASGQITDIEVLQYPHGNGRDVEINRYALPQLIQETLDAQSADIDMVSGATITSDGYLRSLQSALDQETGA